MEDQFFVYLNPIILKKPFNGSILALYKKSVNNLLNTLCGGDPVLKKYTKKILKTMIAVLRFFWYVF